MIERHAAGSLENPFLISFDDANLFRSSCAEYVKRTCATAALLLRSRSPCPPLPRCLFAGAVA